MVVGGALGLQPEAAFLDLSRSDLVEGSSELGESGESRFGIWRMEKKTLETHKEELVVGQTVIYWGLLKRTRDLWALESLLRGHLRSGSVFPCDSDIFPGNRGCCPRPQRES